MFKIKKIAFAGIVGLVLVGCAKATLVDSNSIVVDDIEYYIETNKALYDLGEDVEILYRITNLRDEKWQVLDTAPLWMIFVAPEEAEWFDAIWKLFDPSPPGPGGLTLQPNESAEISVIWPQIDMQGTLYEPGDDTQVPPGIYRITGRLKPTDTNVAVDITVMPEPSSLILFVAGLAILNYVNTRRKG